ncbi:MAG: hypothetical protein RR984_02375 [Bacilli bacterium]
MQESYLYEKVYGFSNKNISSYNSLYDFKDKKVLSVLGSGDQYFSSILFGAKEVDLFDSNRLAWYYFILKYYGIKTLSFKEFYDFFVTSNLSNIKIYNIIRNSLPTNVRDYFDNLIARNIKLSSNKIKTSLFSNEGNFKSGTFIPYFDKETYYVLQNKLNNTKVPNTFFCDIKNLSQDVDNQYDLMLCSNIYHYLFISADEFRSILDEFNIPVFQALYTWSLFPLEIVEFKRSGFLINKVKSVSLENKEQGDYILTLKK